LAASCDHGNKFQVGKDWEFLKRCANVIVSVKILFCKESNYAEIHKMLKNTRHGEEILISVNFR
jgi:hypothetical protein